MTPNHPGLRPPGSSSHPLRVALVYMLFAVVIVMLIAACSRANAAETATDSAGVTAEQAIRFESYQVDSARGIASWAKSCDIRGCADSYTVRWTAGPTTRTVSITKLVDTLVVKRPSLGDSLLVTVSVTPVRRNRAGTARTASAYLTNPDAAPPAVDSLKVDTLAVQAELAFRDTFPVLEVRFAHGRNGFAVAEQRQSCMLYRNRYTGEAILAVPSQYQGDAAREGPYIASCEPIRAAFQAEQSG